MEPWTPCGTFRVGYVDIECNGDNQMRRDEIDPEQVSRGFPFLLFFLHKLCMIIVDFSTIDSSYHVFDLPANAAYHGSVVLPLISGAAIKVTIFFWDELVAIIPLRIWDGCVRLLSKAQRFPLLDCETICHGSRIHTRTISARRCLSCKSDSFGCFGVFCVGLIGELSCHDAIGAANFSCCLCREFHC